MQGIEVDASDCSLTTRGFQLEVQFNHTIDPVQMQNTSRVVKILSSLFISDQTIDFYAMDVAVNAAAGALKAFFADLPDPLIPYSLHPELVEAASEYPPGNTVKD